MANQLFYGDNLGVLRESIADESIDLIYLDPPFNSNATYNVLFKSPTGTEASAQVEAFEDTWHWGEQAALAYDEVLRSRNTDAAQLLKAMRDFLGENDMMAYLAMMAVRLLELHRVLKATGSLYLHCDPTASHYLKILLDVVFGPDRFLNEIIWRRTGSHNSSKRYGPIHDTIFFYSKNKEYIWNPLHRPYMKGHVDKAFIQDRGKYYTNYSGNILTGSGTRKGLSGKSWHGFDPTVKGRHWALPSLLLEGLEHEVEGMNQHQKMDFLLARGFINIKPGDEWPTYRREITRDDGQLLSDIWAYQPYTEGTVFGTEGGVDDDVRWMGSKDSDRLGYPTQKPLALLERIIRSSSNEGDMVLDPFCGCGTAVHAAEKLHRRWIGIDVTCLAIGLIERRLKDAFPGIAFEIHGTPRTLEDALDLAARDKYQFQWWAVGLVAARPYGGKRKGADRGIDGIRFFQPGPKKTESILVSVKGGANVGINMVRELHSVLEREKAPLGVLIALALPTRQMEKEAAAAGFYECDFGKFPRLQIVTLAELFQGRLPKLPPEPTGATFRSALREDRAHQHNFKF